MTIESPDLDFVYGDSDQYDAEIAGLSYAHDCLSVFFLLICECYLRHIFYITVGD